MENILLYISFCILQVLRDIILFPLSYYLENVMVNENELFIRK